MELHQVAVLEHHGIADLARLRAHGSVDALLGREVQHSLHGYLTQAMMMSADAWDAGRGVVQLRLGERPEFRHDRREAAVQSLVRRLPSDAQ
eukprot:16451521-Heterocapsa_arctica.AAC.1